MALRIFIAGVLLLAASLKTTDFIVNYPTINGHGLGAHFNLAVAEMELALSVLLICNVYRRAVHRILIALFAVFAVKSAHSLWIGLKSCGCLGSQIAVPPAISLIFDVVILGALVWQWRRAIKRPHVGVA